MKTDIGQFAMVPLWLARKVSPQALKTFIVLAIRANDQGQAWPSIGTICADLDPASPASENTVRAHLRELRDAGAVIATPRQRDDGSDTSNIYTLFFTDPAMRGQASEAPATNRRGAGSADSTPPLQKTAPPEELEPPEPDEQPEGLKVNPPAGETDWSSPNPDSLALAVFDTLSSVPKFHAKVIRQHKSIEKLVADYLPLAPARAELHAQLGTFYDYYSAEKCRKKYTDGVATLRNWWARNTGRWNNQIQRQGGRTAQAEVNSPVTIVTSNRDELLRRAKSIRQGQRHGE